MKKSYLIIGGIILILLLIVLGGYFYVQSLGKLESTDAILYPEGIVTVERNGQSSEVSQEFSLQLNDIIITKDNSQAKVAFYNSVFVSIDPNTKVSVASLNKDNLKLSQEYGSTWSKVTRLFSVSKYSVETPNSIASVRGTEFGTENNETDTYFPLVDGSLEIDNGLEKYTLTDFGAVNSNKNKINLTDFKNKDKMIQKVTKNIEELKKDRKRVLNHFFKKNKFLLNQLKKQYVADHPEVKLEQVEMNILLDQFISGLDNGEINLKEIKKSLQNYRFVRTEIIDYLEQVDAQIQKSQRILDRLNGSPGLISKPGMLNR